MAKLKGKLFARLSLDYPDHPKIAALSDSAWRTHVEMIIYARKYELDGVLPARVVKTKWETDSVSELQANGNPPSLIFDEATNTYRLHGYEEMQESRADIEARRQVNARNGAKGGRPRKTEKKPNGFTKRNRNETQRKAETETETETDINLSSEVADAPSRPEVEHLCTLLADLVEANGAKRPTVTKRWRDAARLMIDRDGHSVEQIEWLIQWSQRDEFWRANILSMPKFREKFDQLRLKATREHANRRPTLAEQAAAIERFYGEGDAA